LATLQTLTVTKDPSGHSDDVLLAQRVLQGEEASAGEFVQRMKCVPRFLNKRNTRLGSPLNDDDLRDLVQDTLEAIWRKLAEYSGKSSLETWAFSFCINQLMNGIRSKMRRPMSLADELGESEEPAASATMPRLDYELVYLGLEKLVPAQADVIRLKHFVTLTFEQIAERLSMSPNTVKTHYYRGLTRLRALLLPHFGEDYA
jgi:RNA polymerase sigma-70 factor (ECF subfamily)